MSFERETRAITKSGNLVLLGEALRVLEQVDSDLHRERFREQSRALGRDLRGDGQARTVRLTTALARIAATSGGRSRPLDRKDIALMRDGYRALARALSTQGPEPEIPVLKRLTVRIAERLGERG